MVPAMDAWRGEDLVELAAALATRPGHEAVRTQITQILRHVFRADYLALDHEVRMPEVRGRADMLFGATVFEFKSDLRREMDDVRARLPDYLREREKKTGRRYLGISTDGASFVAYELRDDKMVEISRHQTLPDQPDALLAWLEPALSDRDALDPEPLTVQRMLGRDSLTFRRAQGILEALWAGLAAIRRTWQSRCSEHCRSRSPTASRRIKLPFICTQAEVFAGTAGRGR